MKRRILALLMSALMVFQMMPSTVYAEETTSGSGAEYETNVTQTQGVQSEVTSGDSGVAAVLNASDESSSAVQQNTVVTLDENSGLLTIYENKYTIDQGGTETTTEYTGTLTVTGTGGAGARIVFGGAAEVILHDLTLNTEDQYQRCITTDGKETVITISGTVSLNNKKWGHGINAQNGTKCTIKGEGNLIITSEYSGIEFDGCLDMSEFTGNLSITVSNSNFKAISGSDDTVNFGSGTIKLIGTGGHNSLAQLLNATYTGIEFTLETTDTGCIATANASSGETETYLAKIGENGYSTLPEAIAAANDITDSEVVTIDIYGKTEYTDATESLIGAYTEINFVGKTEDAEISITRNGSNGYISGEDYTKKVSFTDLILSKPEGGFANDAGFMNQYFTVYKVAEVSYTNCTFPDGACAQGGEAIYNNCTFANTTSGEYSLWVYADVDCKVNGGSFTGVRGVKMYAEGGATATAGDLTLNGVTFTENVTQKPAIVLTYGESVALIGNIYPSKGVFELDADGAPSGTAVSAVDSQGNDISNTITCVSDEYPNGCGVLVDGKIYTTLDEALTVAESGDTVTLLADATQTVKTPEGVTVDTNNNVIDGTAVMPVNVANYQELKDALATGKDVILTDDIVAPDKAVLVISNQTLDLNEKTLTLNGESGKLTNGVITNGTIKITTYTGDTVADGLFDVGNENDEIPNVESTVTNVEFVSNEFALYAIFDLKVGDLVVNDCTIDMANNTVGGNGGLFFTNGGGKLTMNDCTVIGTDIGDFIANGEAELNNCSITLKGTVENGLDNGINGTALTLNNTTLKIDGATGRGITTDGDDINIKGTSVVTLTNCAEGGVRYKASANINVEEAASLTGTVKVDAAATNAKVNDTVISVTAEQLPSVTVKEGSVTVTEPVVVAQIGDEKYYDLREAMTAAKSGEIVIMLADVDLAGSEWEPVSFAGNFDGQNHTIKNLTINKPGVSNVGFVTSLNGKIANVTFENPTVTGGECTGVVAGRAGGNASLAENINVIGTIKVETTHSGYARAGVIVGGWAYGNYRNITVDGGNKDVSYIKHTGGGDGRYVAGIVGHADDVASYENCTVKNITISGGWLCGGIAGPGPSDGIASGCAVENVNVNADYSGGMFGWYYGEGTIENSSISDVTFTAGSTNNGAIGGYSNNEEAKVENVTISNVKNVDNAPLLNDVAEVKGVRYASLAEAVAAAEDGGTVSLLRDASGEGIIVPEGKFNSEGLIIDFGKYTYTFTEGVGSAGTPTNGFQLLKNNKITLKNGTLSVAEESADKFYILVQNYANLTVQDMTLDGTYLDKYSTTDGDSYTLSNNSGEVVITGETDIIANNDGDKAFAFDVYKNGSYSAPNVTVNTSGTISGNIEVSDGLDANLSITNGVYTLDVSKWCAEGFYTSTQEDGTFVCREIPVYTVGEGKQYDTLNAAMEKAEAEGHTRSVYEVYGHVTLETLGSHGDWSLSTVVGKTEDATLTIIGGGVTDIIDTSFEDITIVDEGTYLPTANEFMYQNFENCTFKNVVFEDAPRLSGTCVATNCTFKNDTDQKYALWMDAGSFTITDSKFELTDEAYGAVKSDASGSDLTLTGNTFDNQSGSEKEALNTNGMVITATGNTFYNFAAGVLPADKTNTLNGTSVTGTEADTAVKESNTVINYAAKIGDERYETVKEALEAVEDGETIIIQNITGSEVGTELDFTKSGTFTITGTAPDYKMPIITVKNETGATVLNIEDATLAMAELDARQNATINVIDSEIVGASSNDIVKSYYNGAINISGDSKVYTMQVTTTAYITIKDSAELIATWQTNVYGNGLITVEKGAVFTTAALNLTGKVYDEGKRDNTDSKRVGEPASIVVDGGKLTVGKVSSAAGADYSYNVGKYGINIGTIEGEAALLDIKNGANVTLYQETLGTNYTYAGIVTIGADGVVNVTDSTFAVASLQEANDVTLYNEGTINVVSESNVSLVKDMVVTGTLKSDGNITGIITEADDAVIEISGGTYSVDVNEWCVEGYVALPDLNGQYVVGEEPTATINNMGAMTIAEEDYIVYGGSKSGDMPLNFVMQFLADQTAEDMETSPFADWYGDFVITITGLENDSFIADDCYLAGYYGDFGWVQVPIDGMTIEEGVRYPVMLGVGMGQKYDYICTGVQDFRCAMYITDEILNANPNLEVKLELSLVDNSKGEDAAIDAITEGKTIYEVSSLSYNVDNFRGLVASVTDSEGNVVKYETLEEALEAVQVGDIVTLLGDTTITEKIEIADSLTIDGDGHVITVDCARGIDVVKGNKGIDVVLKDLEIKNAEGNYLERGVNFNAAKSKLTLNNVRVSGATYALNVPGAATGSTVSINGSELSGNIALNVWAQDMYIVARNTEFVSVDNTEVEDYTAVKLNNDVTTTAEGTEIVISGGSIKALDEAGNPSVATSNATETGTITVSDETIVVGDQKEVVAIISYGENHYSFFTLQGAVDHAADGETIMIIRDSEGAGAVVDKSVTIDFNGKTYTFTEGVGSTGTESNGLQLLQGNDIVLKNGTLSVAEESKEKFYILVQNYSNLTVEDTTLDGTNLDKWSTTDGDSYVLSNNSGNVLLAGATNITANDYGDKAFAFDVCKNGNYEVPVVTVKTTGKISGNIEVSEGLDDKLTIYSGYYTMDVSEWCADTLKAEYSDRDDAWAIVTKTDAVAMIGDVEYGTLSEALNAAKSEDTVKLMKDCTEFSVMVPAGVVLDLNGKMLTATYLVSFGDIVDGNVGGVGGVIVGQTSVVISSDYSQLPLYDSTLGGYRFFAYEVDIIGVYHGSSSNVQQFWFSMLFENKSGLELLQNCESTGFGIKTKLEWTGSNKEVYVAIDNSLIDQWATSELYYYDQFAGEYGGLYLSVSGMNNLETGNTVSVTPVIVLEDTRAADKRFDAMTYVVE